MLAYGSLLLCIGNDLGKHAKVHRQRFDLGHLSGWNGMCTDCSGNGMMAQCVIQLHKGPGDEVVPDCLGAHMK